MPQVNVPDHAAEWLRHAAKDLRSLDGYTSSRVQLLNAIADQAEPTPTPEPGPTLDLDWS